MQLLTNELEDVLWQSELVGEDTEFGEDGLGLRRHLCDGVLGGLVQGIGGLSHAVVYKESTYYTESINSVTNTCMYTKAFDNCA